MWKMALMACATGILLAGCAARHHYTPIDYLPVEVPQTPGGNFTLYVSNQSYAVPLIDIQVYLDGRLAVAQAFEVGNQHNWQTFHFDLEPGEHHIRAVSNAGGATFDASFQTGDRNWAALDYWYYPDDSRGAAPTPRSFTFHIKDEPIQFL